MDPTRLGMNRTGLQMSPVDAARLLERAGIAADRGDGAAALASYREPYLAGAEAVGSVPLPASPSGALRAGMKVLQGQRLHALVDKLGERLAFERSGTRLYDALIAKCEVRSDELDGIDLVQLRRFRDQEAEHMQLVADAIDQLGGDPTAQTPAADIAGVSASGLMQVVLDPRTSVAQSLQAILAAELIDGDGWDLLVALVREEGYDDIGNRFERAIAQEAVHLEHVRSWYERAVLQTLQRSH
jgi:rubrerythrin